MSKYDKNSKECKKILLRKQTFLTKVKKVLQKKGVSKGRIIKYILLVKIKDTTKQLYKRYNYE